MKSKSREIGTEHTVITLVIQMVGKSGSLYIATYILPITAYCSVGAHLRINSFGFRQTSPDGWEAAYGY